LAVEPQLWISEEDALELLFAPVFDKATELITIFVKDIKDELDRKNWKYIYLTGMDASRANLKDAIDRNPIKLFFPCDHGDKDVLYGRSGEIAVSMVNAGLLEGTITSALACLSAAELGPEVIRKGGLAYIGYDEVYGFYTTGDVPVDGFKESAVKVDIELINENTTGDAHKASIKEYDKWIDYWDKSEDPYAGDYMTWLVWDKEHLKLLGDSRVNLRTLRRMV